jgi:hypothetical protein
MIWYVFDKNGLLGQIEAKGTVAASLVIGRKWGFDKIKNNQICWNIHPEPPLWAKWED